MGTAHQQREDPRLLSIPVFGFSGWSGSGKTTLIEKLIPIIQEKGIRITVIKHDVHGVCKNESGKDSFRFKQAGAACILCGPEGPSLSEAIETILRERTADIVFVEGFKSAAIPHIGIARSANGKGFSSPLESFLAVVTDHSPLPCPVPCFDINDVNSIVAFILNNLNRPNSDCK